MMLHGANLIPESFETGEYQVQGSVEIDDLEPVYLVAYAIDTFGWLYNGIYSGIEFLAYDSATLLRAALTQIASSGSSEDSGIDKVISIFTVPRLAFNGNKIPNKAMDSDMLAQPKNITLGGTPTSLLRLYT